MLLLLRKLLQMGEQQLIKSDTPCSGHVAIAFLSTDLAGLLRNCCSFLLLHSCCCNICCCAVARLMLLLCCCSLNSVAVPLLSKPCPSCNECHCFMQCNCCELAVAQMQQQKCIRGKFASWLTLLLLETADVSGPCHNQQHNI